MTAPDPRLDECANCLGCPDCGPVSSKRTVEAIAHRLDKVSEGPWIAWDRGIGYEIHGPHGEPVNDRHRETFSRGDAEFIAMAPGDVHFLLAELRKAREALARVEALHSHAHRDVEPWAIGYRFGGDHCSHDGQHWPCDTRAAVAAAKETE